LNTRIRNAGAEESEEKLKRKTDDFFPNPSGWKLAGSSNLNSLGVSLRGRRGCFAEISGTVAPGEFGERGRDWVNINLLF